MEEEEEDLIEAQGMIVPLSQLHNTKRRDRDPSSRSGTGTGTGTGTGNNRKATAANNNNTNDTARHPYNTSTNNSHVPSSGGSVASTSSKYSANSRKSSRAIDASRKRREMAKENSRQRKQELSKRYPALANNANASNNMHNDDDGSVASSSRSYSESQQRRKRPGNKGAGAGAPTTQIMPSTSKPLQQETSLQSSLGLGGGPRLIMQNSAHTTTPPPLRRYNSQEEEEDSPFEDGYDQVAVANNEGGGTHYSSSAPPPPTMGQVLEGGGSNESKEGNSDLDMLDDDSSTLENVEVTERMRRTSLPGEMVPPPVDPLHHLRGTGLRRESLTPTNTNTNGGSTTARRPSLASPFSVRSLRSSGDDSALQELKQISSRNIFLRQSKRISKRNLQDTAQTQEDDESVLSDSDSEDEVEQQVVTQNSIARIRSYSNTRSSRALLASAEQATTRATSMDPSRIAAAAEFVKKNHNTHGTTGNASKNNRAATTARNQTRKLSPKGQRSATTNAAADDASGFNDSLLKGETSNAPGSDLWDVDSSVGRSRQSTKVKKQKRKKKERRKKKSSSTPAPAPVPAKDSDSVSSLSDAGHSRHRRNRSTAAATAAARKDASNQQDSPERKRLEPVIPPDSISLQSSSHTNSINKHHTSLDASVSESVHSDNGRTYRAEALDELANTIRDTVDEVGPFFDEKQNVEADFENLQDDGHNNSSGLGSSSRVHLRFIPEEDEDESENDDGSPEKKKGSSSLGPRLAKGIVHYFNDLLGVLLQLSGELELASTFLSNASSGNLISPEAVHAILAHIPVLDLVFSELKPTLLAIYESKESLTTSDGNETLRRILIVVRLINETSFKVSQRLEWNAKSETAYVTLLELLQRMSHELIIMHEEDDGWDNDEPAKDVTSKLRRAWQQSGNETELKLLQDKLLSNDTNNDLDSDDEDDGKKDGISDFFRQVCYKVLISTDIWCPNERDLNVVTGVGFSPSNTKKKTMKDGDDEDSLKNEPYSARQSHDAYSFQNSNHDRDGNLVDVPFAVADILHKIRGEPLPRESTVDLIMRRLIPYDVPSSTSATNSSSHGSTSLVRGSIDVFKKENICVAVSSVPEIPNDPTALGLGGCGKTTLAAIVASRDDVRQHFKDGIVWLYMGGRPEKDMPYEMYVACLLEICSQLSVKELPEFDAMFHIPRERSDTRNKRETTFLNRARAKLSDLLEGRSVLIILDDVAWRRDVDLFKFQKEDGEDSRITVMVTTNVRNLLPNADTVEVDLLDDSESVKMLISEAELPLDHQMTTSVSTKMLVRDCARQPLAVRSVGRWLSLKHATLASTSSVEDVGKEMARSIHALVGKGDINYEIMGLSFSPAVNDKPTQVIKFCFAAFVHVFCQEQRMEFDPTKASPIIPMEAANILFETLLRKEEATLFQEGSLFNIQQREAIVLIPEALSALGVFEVTSETEEADDSSIVEESKKLLQVQHDIQLEYGEYLAVASGGLGNLINNAEISWNRAFVTSSVDAKGGFRWDDADPDPCRRYALEMIISHMLRGGMLKEAAVLLGDESFVRGRIISMTGLKGAMRQIKDCEALFQKLKDEKIEGLDPVAVMELAYQTIGSLLVPSEDGIEENKEVALEAGLAQHQIAFSLAEKQCWLPAIVHWQSAQELLVSAQDITELVAAVLYNIGTALCEVNEFGKAIGTLKQALQIRESIHGVEHILCAETKQKLAEVYLSMSDYGEALECYSSALYIMNLDPGRYMLEIGIILNNVGLIHYSRGEIDEAQKCYKNAIRSLEMEGEASYPELAVTYQRMGNCSSDTGFTDEAIEQFQESIRLKGLEPNVSGENASDILAIEGMIHNLNGDEEKGLKCYEKALRALKREAPTKKEKIASIQHLIGCVFLIRGNNKKAMKKFEQSLQTRREMSASFVHLDVASTLFNIAFLHQTRNKFHRALRCLEEALKIRKMRLPDSERVANTYEKIGSISVIVGDYDRAEVAFEEALVLRRALDDQSESVALVLHEMGDLYDGLTEYDEAITCFREAMDIRRQRVEENPDDVTASTLYAATLYSMGFTLHNQDIDARALRVFDEALEIRRACLGDNAREVGDTLNIMGFLKAKSGQLDGSLQLLLEALRIRRLNGDLIKASDTYKNIGNVQREQGDGERALLSYKEALALRKEVLSDDHEKVADALIAIGNIKSDMEDHEGAMMGYQEALTIRVRAHGANSDKVASVVQVMGMMEFRAGEHERAKGFLEEFIRIKKASTQEPDSDFVNILFTIGNISKIQGRINEAQEAWAEAFDIFNELGLAEENPKIAKAMKNLLKNRKSKNTEKNKEENNAKSGRGGFLTRGWSTYTGQSEAKFDTDT